MSSPHRVLFVEDYGPFKRSFARLLKRGFGLDVTVAESGEEAIGQFGAIDPELVILDIGLPGVNGTQTLQVIRALPGGDEVPVIVLTGSNDPELVNATAALEVDGYVLKENATDEFAEHILSVFPDLDGLVRDRFRSLVGSTDFKNVRRVLAKNSFVVGHGDDGVEAVRVLLPEARVEKSQQDVRWLKRLTQRAFPRLFD